MKSFFQVLGVTLPVVLLVGFFRNEASRPVPNWVGLRGDCLVAVIQVREPQANTVQDLNQLTQQEWTGLLQHFAEQLSEADRRVWLPSERGAPIAGLAQALFQQRSENCGGFDHISRVVHAMVRFAHDEKISMRNANPLLQKMLEAKVLADLGKPTTEHQ